LLEVKEMSGKASRLVCVLFLIIAFMGLFLVSPAQAQNDNNQGNNVSTVPEPMTLALLGLGLAGGLVGIGFPKRK
jgi:hypothetical protein